MSSMPILRIFKSSDPIKDSGDLFSEFKKIQTIKKQKAVEEVRREKVEGRIKDLSEELEEKVGGVSRILANQAYLSASDFLEFLQENYSKFKDPENSFIDVEKEFFKFVSVRSTKDKPDGFLTVYAEIDDSGHLVVCSNKDTCTTHKSHLGMGLLRIDAKDFTNE